MQTFSEWLIAEASTLADLENSTIRSFPATKARHNAVNGVSPVDGFVFTPIPERRELVVDTKTRSMRNGTIHVQRIIFHDVDYVPEDTANAVQIPDTKYFILPIPMNAKTVQVACDCLDFRFRFAPFNHADGSLAGEPPPPYERVPGSTRPPANPYKTPGMCKHLMKIAQLLQSAGIVV